VRNRIEATYEDMGEQEVKNVSAPVRAYAVLSPDAEMLAVQVVIMQRPALAVLPFDNMSGDVDQEYFADGLTEDIITALTAWRSFPVIGRNSTFTFKDRAVKAQDVAAELGARYILEGSVRKAGERVRVTAQLLDAETGHHVWAERYDEDLIDVFDLQDKMTRQIVAHVAPEVARAELQKSEIKPPANLDAWDYYIRGGAELNAFKPDAGRQGSENVSPGD
jgi:adenylate cyclase